MVAMSEEYRPKKGICHECGDPLENSSAIGYHDRCARLVYERETRESNIKFPFIVRDGEDNELDVFTTKEEANDFLTRMKMVYVERVDEEGNVLNSWT
jgi:hypothetical protein